MKQFLGCQERLHFQQKLKSCVLSSINLILALINQKQSENNVQKTESEKYVHNLELKNKTIIPVIIIKKLIY